MQNMSLASNMQVKINNTEGFSPAHHFFPTSSQPSRASTFAMNQHGFLAGRKEMHHHQLIFWSL